MGILERHHVAVTGPAGARPVVFVHGFGCDQTMWRHVAPAFADRYRVIAFDHVGAGGSTADYDEQKYATLNGYAADVLAPDSVGEYVAKAVPDATLVRMAATGHCPNLSAPEETIAAIDHFLRRLQAA